MDAVITYRGMHSRLARIFGPAWQWECECGAWADHWAYTHSDPNELWDWVNGRWLAYSLELEHYGPMCASCHNYYDRYTPYMTERPEWTGAK